jgi:hypothetical protein
MRTRRTSVTGRLAAREPLRPKRAEESQRLGRLGKLAHDDDLVPNAAFLEGRERQIFVGAVVFDR